MSIVPRRRSGVSSSLLQRLMRRFVGAPKAASGRGRDRRNPLMLESLEPRLLLSADLNFNLTSHSDVTVRSEEDASSVLYIDIIDNATGAVIRHDQALDSLGNPNFDKLVLTGTLANERVRIDIGSGVHSAVNVGIEVNMVDGDDAVEIVDAKSTATVGKPVTIDGGAGIDTIVGNAPLDFTLNNVLLKFGTTGPTVTLSNIDAAFLTGVSFTNNFTAGPVATANIAHWTEQGPGPMHNGQLTGIPNKPVSGAIQAVLAHPSDANVIYIGAAAGGVWKTTDGGTNWTPLTDQMPSQSFTSLAFDDADVTRQTLYAGMGKVSSYYDFGKAIGILKTVDGGKTWKLINHSLFADNSVFGIAANGNTVLAATKSGLMRSTDAGVTWQRMAYSYVESAAPQVGGSGYAVGDVVMHQYGTSPADVVQLKVSSIGAAGAVTGLSVLNAGSINSLHTMPVNPVAMVTQSGAGSGLTVSLMLKNSGLSNGYMSELVADFSQNVIYVANATSGINNNGIYRSLDGGATFLRLADPGNVDFTTAVRIRLSLGAPTGGNPTLFAGVVDYANTTLTADAALGATQVTLASIVGVEIGDKLVLPTIPAPPPGVPEEAIKVTAIDRVTKVVTLATGLAKARVAGDAARQEFSNERVTQIIRVVDPKDPGGNSLVWTVLDVPGDSFGGISPGGQADKHFSLLADRSNPDVVYVGGDLPPKNSAESPVGDSNPKGWTGRLFRGDASLATGSQWSSITDDNANGTAPHADSRNMVFRVGGDIIEVDDGGIKRLANPSSAARVWHSLDGNLRLTEFISVSYDPNGNIIAGGAQDNGSSRQNAPGSMVWTQLIAGDGSITHWAVGPSTSTLYSSAQNFGPFTAYEGLSTTEYRPDLEVNHTGFFDDDELHDFDDKVQFTTQWEINEIDPALLMIGTTFLYEEDPDFLIGGAPGDDVTLQNGSPVKVDGKYKPDPGASIGVVTSVAYGGHIRPLNSPLEDVPRVAYASAIATRPDATGTPRSVGVIYVRLGEDQKFVEIRSWGGSVPNDIVMDPEDWRRLYVLDANGDVWHGMQSTPSTATYAWQKLSGNLDTLSRVSSVKGEFKTIEVYLDEGVNQFIDTDDKRVLLVGGYGGVYRAINPVDNNAVWSEFGAGMPNILVTDVRYDAKDDLLLAGTLGRGALTVEHASQWLATPAELKLTGETGNVNETFRLGVNAAKPWLLDITAHDTATPTAVPLGTLPLAGIDRITIVAGGGDDTITLDGANGVIAVPAGIHIDGGTGTNTLSAAWLGAASSSTPALSTYSVTAPDGFGTQRKVDVTFSMVPAPPTVSINPVDASGGGLAQLSESLRDMLDNSLFGSNVPFFDAGSLSGGLSGRTLDTSTPPPLKNTGQDVRAGVAGGPVQVDDGSSILSRLFDSGTFSLARVGQVGSLAQLRAELDALDGINGNVVLAGTPSDPTLHVQVVRDLLGVVDLDIDGAAILGALNLADGKIEIEGIAEIGFRAALDLTFGIDANGFYVAPNAAGVNELEISRITIAPAAVKASGHFGWLGVDLVNPTITFDEDVGVSFKLNELGALPDGKIRLEELVAAPAGMMTMQLVEDAAQTDLVVNGLLAVAAVVPGFDVQIPVADAAVTLTWADLSDDVAITFDSPAAQGAVDFLRFVSLDPATLVTQLGDLDAALNDLAGGIDFDLPFVSLSLDGLVDVSALVNDHLLSRLGFQMGGVGPILPDFGTVQEFTTGLYSSLLEHADPSNYVDASDLFDLADLPEHLTYDSVSGELVYSLDFRRAFTLSDTLDLDFNVAGGLGEFTTSSNVALTGMLKAELKLGVDLKDAFDGDNPLDWIFLRDASLEFSIDADATDIDALARFGFVKIEVVDGTAHASLSVDVALTDPNTNLKGDNRIDLREIKDAVLGDIGSLFELDASGSANLELPVKVPFLGITDPTANDPLTVTIPDLTDLATAEFDFGSLGNLGLDGFGNIDAASIVGLLGQLTYWLDQFRQSDSFAVVDLPVVGPGLDNVLTLADAVRDKLLFDDGDDGIDDSRSLLGDINAALGAAGLGGRIHAESHGDNKIRLVANDDTVTSIVVDASAGLGFTGAEVAAGTDYKTLTGTSAVAANGQLAADTTLRVKLDGAASFVDVAVSRVSTFVAANNPANNNRVGNDRWKLVDASNAATFVTVEDMVKRLNYVLGSPLVFDSADDTLTFNLSIAELLGKLDVPLDFLPEDLPSFLTLQTQGAVRLQANANLDLTLGFYIGNAGGTTLDAAGNTALAILADPVSISDRRHIDAPNPIGSVTGQLSNDMHFNVFLDGAPAAAVTVAKNATTSNQTVADLVADMNTAIGQVAALNGKLQAVLNGARVDLQTVGAGHTSLTVTTANGDPMVKELGFLASQTGTPIAGGNFKAAGGKDLPVLFGRLPVGSDAQLTFALGGGAPVAVTIAAAATVNNRFAYDIVSDIQAAIEATPALMFDDPDDDTTDLVPRVKVGVVGGKLSFQSKDGASAFVMTANAAALQHLGLAATPTGNGDDLVITTRGGSTHRVNLDGAVSLADIFAKIATQTGNQVTGEVNSRHSAIKLTDHSTPVAGKAFTVLGATGEIAGIGLGIVRPDAQQGETADGVIEGANIAGLRPLDRFFIVEDPTLASIGLSLATPGGVSAQAGIGFVGVELLGNGTATATLTLGLEDPEPDATEDGRVSLQELLDSLDDPSSLFDIDLTGSGSFTLDIQADADLAGLGIDVPANAGFDVALDFGTLLNDGPSPVSPSITVTPRNLGELLSFSAPEFNFQSILAGLRLLTDFLDDFESFGFLNEPLPVVNISVSELIDVAGKFAEAVDAAQANPASTVQLLEDKLREAFGLAPSSTLIQLVLVHDDNGTAANTVDDFDVLKFDLSLLVGFSEQLSVDFDLGLPIDLGGGADLRASGEVTLDLDFGFRIDDPTQIFVYDSTGIGGSLNLAGDNLTFRAAVGPLGIFVEGGTVDVHGTLPGGELFSAGLSGAGFVNNRKELGDISVSDLEFSVSGLIDVDLPVYFPTDSIKAGTVLFDASLSYVGGELNTTFDPRAVKPDGVTLIPLAELFAFDPSQLSLLDQLLLGVDGIDLFLGGLQDILDGEIGGIELPLIGDKLAGAADGIGNFRDGFVEEFRSAIEQLADPSVAFAGSGYGGGPGVPVQLDPVSQILYDLLGPGGIGLLDSQGDIVFTTNINQAGVLPEDVYFDWDLTIGSTLLNVGAGIGFDIGIPGLGLETKGDVHLDVAWELLFGFGLNTVDGFYFDIGNEGELQLDVDVTVPGIEITGTLGFLQLTAKEDTDEADGLVTHLGATFAIDVYNRNDENDDKLGFSELGRIGIDAKIAADAVADLAMQLSLSSDLVPDAPTNFPSLVADFLLKWQLGDRANDDFVSLTELDGSFLKNGLQYIGFDHVGLDLGSYFSDLIGPIVSKVQEITEPIKPFLDFLTTPIPVISDLAGPTSLLDIAEISGVVNPGIVKAIEVIDQIVDIAHSIDVDSGENAILYFDSFLPSLVIFDASAAPLAGGFDLSNPNLDLKGLSETLLSGLDFLPDEIEEALGGVASDLVDGLSKMLPGGGAAEGFSLPIIEDPSQIFGMLMGQPAVLVQYDMAALEVSAEFSAFFSLLGPLGVSINAEFDAQFGPFTFGYDTLGIQEFAGGDFKNPLTLFDGFFVGDLDAQGADVPELQFDAALWAAAELNLAIARGGVGGGLYAEIDFDLHDPNDDGRVRVKEIVANVVNEFRYGEPALSPLAMFDITGKLTAELFAFVKVDLGLFSIDEKWHITDPVTLLDFESNFVRVPTLATELGGGVLQLNMGKSAEQRIEGDLSDGDEVFVVKQKNASEVWVWSTLVDFNDNGVYDQSEAQSYDATSLILALGGEGNDTIDLSGVTSNIKYELEGNAGDDTIKAGVGSGAASIKGGAGDDELWGGGGADNVFGEGGKDEVHGGAGDDWLFGDGDAKKAIVGNVITVAIKAVDADDKLWGDDGDDLMFGGGGSELEFHGGAGDDVMIGDGGKVTVSGRIVAAVDTGRLELQVSDTDKGKGLRDVMFGDGDEDHLYGGGGDDDLHGGAEDDVLYGESGKDTLFGDAGNDVALGDAGSFKLIDAVLTPVATVGGEDDQIHGGAGDDRLVAGAGNDQVWGDDGKDQAWGGTGKDTMHGGANDDLLFGEADPDALYGEAGDDYLEGGGGNDLAQGGADDDTLVAGYGSDTLDGETGSDLYRITARGGPTTELTTAYDAGTSPLDTDSLVLVGTQGADTVLLRAMADSYFPTLGKLDGLIVRYLGSTLADKLAAMLQSFNDAYGPHDLGYGMADALTARFQLGLLPGLKGAIDSTWENVAGAPTIDALKALVQQVFDSKAGSKLDAMQKAIADAYGEKPVPSTMFDALRAAYQTMATTAQLQSAIQPYYVAESLFPTLEGLKQLVQDVFEDPDVVADVEKQAILDSITTAYGAFDPAIHAPGLLAAVDAAYDAANSAPMLAAIAANYDPDPVSPATFTNTAFVSLINNGGANVERFNYRHMEGLVVNALGGNDYVVLDDLLAAATINLGLGNDRAQIGQVFRSERVKDFGDELITGITAEDMFTTVEITRGWLSNGISVPTTISGGGGDDNFTVFHNVAVLNLNGGDGDDVFTVRAFALKGSSDNERARTDMKGDGGADTILYVVNAPVGIDGGDGFDTVRIVGTEFGDDFVVTDSGIFGAGLNVTYVNIEKLVADGAEGDDRFFVLSTGLEVVTEIDGGLGSDTFFVGGNPSRAPVAVVSNDLRGHSGIILHRVESGDLAYAGLQVEGLSVNVGDDEEPMILVYESEGRSTVFEGATAGGEGWAYDTYTVRLSRAPAPGKKVYVTALPAGLSPEDQALGYEDLEFEVAPDVWQKDLPLVFTTSNWSTGMVVKFRATQDIASEGRRFNFINHKVNQAPDSDLSFLEAQALSVKVEMNDDDRDGVVVTASGGVNKVIENGGAIDGVDTFSVVLSRLPTADVTVQMTTANGEVGLSTANLLFTTANWNIAQTVTVTPTADGTVEGFHTDFIAFTVQSDDMEETKTLTPGQVVHTSGADITVDGSGWLKVDGNFDLAGVQSIPPTKPTSYVLLPHRPVADTLVVRVDGVELAESRFDVAGNTVSFKAASGAPELRVGLVEVKYNYLESGYDGHAVRDSVVDIIDDDAPTVVIEQIGNGSTDVVEGDASSTDTYRVRLSKAPTQNVSIRADAVETRTTWGGTAYFEEQVTVNGASDSLITFTPANWHDWQTVTVSALSDTRLDGNDTQVFAPDLQTVNKIRGPLIIDGAAGAGSLSLPMPLMMPWERNVRSSDGDVISFTKSQTPEGAETMVVETADLETAVEKLQADDPTLTVAKLVGKTLEMTQGPGLAVTLDPNRPDDRFDRFWLITQVQVNGAQTTLTLKNPTAVDPTKVNVVAPDSTSEYAITALSINFFADEREQIDYLFAFDNDSVANDIGALTSSDGVVYQYTGSALRVDTSALQSAANLLGLGSLAELHDKQIEITVGPGQGRTWTIQSIVDHLDPNSGQKLVNLVAEGGDLSNGVPTDRSEFRIAGSDRHGRITGFGMGPNVLFSGKPQGGGITYGDLEVVQLALGAGNDTVRVDYATNAEDHATKRSGDFHTLTLLDTGGGNDQVTVRLDDGDANAAGDGAFSLDLGNGNDTVSSALSTRSLVVFGGTGNDVIVGGSGDDILFGDIGRVDHVKTTTPVGGTPLDEVVTRLGHSVAQNPVNPHVTGATARSVSDSTKDFRDPYNSLLGMSVQAISPDGHVQFRTIVGVSADGHTLQVDRDWDQLPVFAAPNVDDRYYYRVSALPEDQTDGSFRGVRLVWSILETVGGDDTIDAGGGADMVIGGQGADTLRGGVGADRVIGDNARIDHVPLVGGDGATRANVLESIYPGLGGIDTLYGDAGTDLLVGAAKSDKVDGGSDDDLVFGDNVRLQWSASIDAIGPRFVGLLAGATTLYDANGAANAGTHSALPYSAPDWANWTITLDQSTNASQFGDDYLAGGAGNDEIFGQRGNDTIQGDGSIGEGVSALRTAIGLTVDGSVEAASDGDDYIEGNAGNDLVFGNLGQDDIVGGSSSLFSLGIALRDDGNDLIFGGAGTDVARNDAGDGQHGRDADAIAGDNANIYRTVAGGAYLGFGYDDSYGIQIVPRMVALLDYSPGGFDRVGAAANADKGAADELHGESGDDAMYGMTGSDVLYGEAGDDDLIGGWGNEWLSGGSGDDALLGDDGRVMTSRNGSTEPLSGVTVAVQQGSVATGGNAQQADINVAGVLKKSVNLTPFSNDTAWNGTKDEFDGVTTARNDDILFGGLGGDWLHGGSGDDALSGAEALTESYAPTYAAAGTPNGRLRIDYDHPVNPGNVLAFNPADADGKKPGQKRAGEFALYDEYNPMRRILIETTGVGGATGKEFFLNFASTEGPLDAAKNSDGDDKLFGDLGNDWLVGGTGRDNMYGGFGNDLMNADDDLATNGGLNNQPDTATSYFDRAFGGAGRDVLIANTAGDRLIDWTGEFNSYLVPFSPFGNPTVSRTLQPALPEFLYALSRSDGADPTRAGDVPIADPARNGEPFGELGIVLQKDAAWKDQHGGPADPQPGNSNSKRDLLRSANFDGNQSQGFVAVAGSGTVVNGRYQVAPVAGSNGDSLSIFDQSDTVIPNVFEMQAVINAVKPTGGTRANAYLIFDYWSPTDFKFAGIDVSTNKLQIGQRNASGWVVNASTNFQAKSGTDYIVLLKVNYSAVTLTLGNTNVSYGFAPRVDSLGVRHAINDGIAGIGANGASAQIDNLVVQAQPGAITLDKAADFSAAQPASSVFVLPAAAGTWTSSAAGRFESTSAGVNTPSLALMKDAVSPGALLEITTTLRTGGEGGVVFDYHSPTYFKYVTLSASGEQLLIGHRDGSAWVTDAAYSVNLSASTDYKLLVTVRSGLVNASLNGVVVATKLYNEPGTDGRYGVLARSGLASFNDVRVRTDDVKHALPPAPLSASSSTPLQQEDSGASRPSWAELQSLVDAARHRWAAAGAPAEALARMAEVSVQFGSLEGAALAHYTGMTVVIDDDAAGQGWFVDASPHADQEFRRKGDTLVATRGVAAGRIDLLSVISHELGHAAGLDHHAGSVMAETLRAGERRLPGAMLAHELPWATPSVESAAFVVDWTAPLRKAGSATPLPKVAQHAMQGDWKVKFVTQAAGTHDNPNAALRLHLPMSKLAPPLSSKRV